MLTLIVHSFGMFSTANSPPSFLDELWIPRWPRWSANPSDVQDPKFFMELPKVFAENTSDKKRQSPFVEAFEKEIRRNRNIKLLWSLFAVLLFFSLAFAALFGTNYYFNNRAGLYFLPCTCFAVASVLTLIKVRNLKRRQPRSSTTDSLSEDTAIPVSLLTLRAESPRLFYQNDHGVIFEIASNFWSAQNWFLLFSPDEKHRNGVSMEGLPPAAPILVLKSDIDKFLQTHCPADTADQPHSRKCTHLRAVQHNKALMGQFIKAANKEQKTKRLKKPRERWLKTASFIHSDWSAWKLYRTGNLKGNARNDFEEALIEALTGSQEKASKSIDILSNFMKPDIRPFNKWIRDLDVVPEEYIKKV